MTEYIDRKHITEINEIMKYYLSVVFIAKNKTMKKSTNLAAESFTFNPLQ